MYGRKICQLSGRNEYETFVENPFRICKLKYSVSELDLNRALYMITLNNGPSRNVYSFLWLL